jgi:hypothetical protein
VLLVGTYFYRNSCDHLSGGPSLRPASQPPAKACPPSTAATANVLMVQGPRLSRTPLLNHASRTSGPVNTGRQLADAAARTSSLEEGDQVSTKAFFAWLPCAGAFYFLFRLFCLSVLHAVVVGASLRPIGDGVHPGCWKLSTYVDFVDFAISRFKSVYAVCCRQNMSPKCR